MSDAIIFSYLRATSKPDEHKKAEGIKDKKIYKLNKFRKCSGE